MRAITSGPVPGEYGTIIVIGRLDKLCAAADTSIAVPARTDRHNANIRSIILEQFTVFILDLYAGIVHPAIVERNTILQKDGYADQARV